MHICTSMPHFQCSLQGCAKLIRGRAHPKKNKKKRFHERSCLPFSLGFMIPTWEFPIWLFQTWSFAIFTHFALFRALLREAPDTFNFLRHVMRAIWSVRPKGSHRCVSLRETPLKPVQSLKHTTKNSAEQTVMRTKWFKHIAI